MAEAIEFIGVTRAYGALRAVDGLSLAIHAGEFFSMLGPSGSGKTTCLRLIAGFELPDRGTILLGGRDVSQVPPFERNVNTVFQDYALFPHLSVLENVAYGPRVRGVPRGARESKARGMLELVRLESLGDRRPGQLSGGQRQRVALARALINEPAVLLLDEPLGALDLKLREEMQGELRALQRRLGITFVYVTHDQGEALSMSDRVAVFNAGRIEQLSTPQQLYQRPRTAFVARFVGSANVIEAPLAGELTGTARPFALRAEDVRLSPAGTPPPAEHHAVDAEVVDVQYHGATSRWLLRLPGDARLVATRPAAESAGPSAAGTKLRACWPAAAAVPLEG
ncbi:MAG TPA: ABC transporter ATP-binding protein [Steroidobacteraceae bacterium]|nr:ABC transporter ATP-binding protein [Steroidobacteraceae bacterium]